MTTTTLINKFVKAMALQGIEAHIETDWMTYEERFLNDEPPAWLEITFYKKGEEVYSDTVYDGDDFDYDLETTFGNALYTFGFVPKDEIKCLKQDIEYYKSKYRYPNTSIAEQLLGLSHDEAVKKEKRDAIKAIKKNTLRLLELSRLKAIDF